MGGGAWGAADSSDVAAIAGTEMPQGTVPSSHPQPHTIEGDLTLRPESQCPGFPES